MPDLFAVQSSILLALSLVLFVCKAVALIDVVTRRDEAFVATGKQTKNFWLVVLGLAVAAHLLLWGPINLINLLGTVAALVYLADVRPAVKGLTRR